MRRFRLPRHAVAAMAAVAAALVLPFGGHDSGAAAVRGAGQAAITQNAGERGSVRTDAVIIRTAATGAADASAGTTTAATVATTATVTTTATATTTAAEAAAASGGLCSVPGIGDIGGLLGFCSLGTSGLTGDLNNICQPSLPEPEPANSGIDSMVAPPPSSSGKQPATLYDEYGVAGDYWAATNLQCSDMTSLIGNNVAGMVFDAAKSLDRVTITTYQSAAGNGIISWLQRVTDKLITSLGNAIYFPYLAVVVILAAIWLAWQGLIRKRGTRTIEGTIWMIVACAAALFLIGKPAEVTGLGAGVSNGISQALNVAFAKLPSPGPSSCVPLQKGDPQVPPSTYSYTSGNTVVDQNADELWTVLVCKPWLVGEFGTSAYSTGTGKPTAVNTYGRSLLWAQAIAVNEKPTSALIQAKQSAYAGIASSIQTNDPAIYPLFQGNQWTTRLEVAFAALFAAVVAGVLVLLISVTLILLKLSFLLLLIVGPFFLLIGTHPGFGRVVALRWVEMLVGVLLKQAAIALVLSLLLYCYALIMGTSDLVLPWALKILMIALVTVAAFIYRKPFQHLFSAVGYGVIGSEQRAELDLARAGAAARANTRAAATVAVPGFAAYRSGRWARRNPGQAAGLALAAASGGAATAAAAGLQAGEPGAAAGTEAGIAADGTTGAAGAADAAGGRTPLSARARAVAGAAAKSAGTDTEPPPLNLPARNGSVSAASVASAPGTAAAGGIAGTAAAAAGAGPAIRPAGAPRSSAATAAARSASDASAASRAPVIGGAAAGGGSAGSAATGAPAPGAWPLGRSAAPSPAALRPPAAASPRQASPSPAAGSGGGQLPAPAQRGPAPVKGGQRPARPASSEAPAPGRPVRTPGGGPSSRRQVPQRGPSGQTPGQDTVRQPVQRQPAQRQSPQRPAAPPQRARSQPAERQPAERQPSLGSRLRTRWSDGAAPARESGTRQSPAPQSGTRRSPAPRSSTRRSPAPEAGAPPAGRAPAGGSQSGRPARPAAPRQPAGLPLGGGRQGQPPRSPSGANRAESGSAAPEQSGQWQGQPMTGPLANPPGETERPVPFWLRSIRRK
ncbi:MAG TPA: type IV secretion system protein [Streptosporangiaceae bacterium]|nr:type IV secretion system protein [Streptosporangiaceae bacterium]